MSTLHGNFNIAIDRATSAMRDYSRPVQTDRWQGVDISKRPEGKMREVIGWDFRVPMDNLSITDLQAQIMPSLPWADEHFAERICGFPMNPGESWKHWPYANSAANFLDANGKFEVNYMERFWGGSRLTGAGSDLRTGTGEFENTPNSPLMGIRGRQYGDLANIVDLLVEDPLTRQAWLPIFWPEDTGAGGRVPCSLGYHWIMRGGYLHIHYPIRSCDFHRHFRDDIYLAVRLTFWLLDRLKERRSSAWHSVKPGYFSMWIGSLHMFINDYNKLFRADGTS